MFSLQLFLYFPKQIVLMGAFLDVDPSSNSDVLTHCENERICSEYGDSSTPLIKCVFSILGIQLPFNDFKMEFFKHLMFAPSYLHPMN